METWYIMVDGSVAPPRDVKLDPQSGLYRHRDGRPVAYSEHGPRTRGVDPAAEAKAGKKAEAPSPAKPGADPAKEMKPEEVPAGKPKTGYKTRETKAG